jgi:hypothetical protein
MDESKNCLLVAKNEYTTILIYQMYPSIYQGIRSMWNDAKRDSHPQDAFCDFQIKLSRVRKWNQDLIETEYRRMVDKTKCEWFDDLLTKIFVLNVQILAAVNNDHNTKIKVKVPKGDKFIHCCYKECARSFFENPLLMEDRSNLLPRIEQSKNLQKSYKLIVTCIENTIRNLLPIEKLVTTHLQTNPESPPPHPLPTPPPPPPSTSTLPSTPLEPGAYGTVRAYGASVSAPPSPPSEPSAPPSTPILFENLFEDPGPTKTIFFGQTPSRPTSTFDSSEDSDRERFKDIMSTNVPMIRDHRSTQSLGLDVSPAPVGINDTEDFFTDAEE